MFYFVRNSKEPRKSVTAIHGIKPAAATSINEQAPQRAKGGKK